MFYVEYYDHIYPVLKVQPIIENLSDGKNHIVRTEFLIPNMNYEGIATNNFWWIDAEDAKYLKEVPTQEKVTINSNPSEST